MEDYKSQEIAKGTRLTIENYYTNLFKFITERKERRKKVVDRIHKYEWGPSEAAPFLESLQKKESEYIRSRRVKLTLRIFEKIKIIGRGAFGEVHLVKMKTSDNKGKVCAMKVLSKARMIEKGQANHVLAERDVLAASNAVYNNNPWVVKLLYSFQDVNYLYLIMEYVQGGDMMTYLIRYSVFSEDTARFFIAETVVAIHTIHNLGYMHRDIKPDNLLLDKTGHIKLCDFGLCSVIKGTTEPDKEKKYPITAAFATSESKASTWAKKRRELAYSNVGTPDYTAPEVLLGAGYSKECDWWSVGIILFEMLIGYPPFFSETQSETYQKIIEYQEVLPAVYRESCGNITREAQDLIQRFLSPPTTRIGSEGGMHQILSHPFFKGIDWRTIRKQISPIVPQINSDIDAQNFDEFNDGDIFDSYLEGGWDGVKKLKTTDIPFIGFTYRNYEALHS